MFVDNPHVGYILNTMSHKKQLKKEDIEREYLNVPRNIEDAAIILGVSKKTLIFYMKQLGMSGKDHKWNVASRDTSSSILRRKQYIPTDLIKEGYLESPFNIKVSAKNIGCSVEFLRTSMKYHQIKAKKKNWNTDHPSGKQRLDITKGDREEMVRLYITKNRSIDQIAGQYGLSMGATRSILVYRGVKMRQNEDTSIEIEVHNELMSRGLLFEKQKKIIGLPDVFIEPNICIFADGDYWHGNPEKIPAGTRIRHGGRTLSMKEIQEKDKKITDTLTNMGYKVFRFWENEIHRDVGACIDRIFPPTIDKPQPTTP